MDRHGEKSEGVNRSTGDYFRTVGWVLALLYLFLALFALVSGRIAGLEYAFRICISAGIVVTIIFVTIIALNVLVLGVVKIVNRCKKTRRLSMQRRVATGRPGR